MARRQRLVRSLLGGAFAISLVTAADIARAQPGPPADAQAPKTAPDDENAPETRETPNTPTGANAEQVAGQAGTAEVPAEPAAAPGTAAAASGAGGASPKRAMPDYDGRGAPPTTAGDVLLWIPRVLFSPLYFVSEYMIRRPLGWFIETAEKKQWPEAIRDFFTFGPEKKAGVVPTAFLDLGFRPSIGIYAFWDDLLGKGNHLRLHLSTFGTNWLQGALADRIPLSKDSSLDLRVEGVSRPDAIFYGLGPNSTNDQRHRYGWDMFRARPVFESFWWRGSRVTTEAGVKYMHFRNDGCCDDNPVAGAVDQGVFPPPPGFLKGYTAVYQRGELTVDTREPRTTERITNQSGFRMELEVENGADVRHSQSSWIRYGGSIGGFLDIKDNRVVSLSVTTLFVDPMSSGAQIPFTEQIILGGSGPMRGFLYGRLIDRSAAVATLKYRWPIWVFLDGTAQAALGNVFGPQLDDFKSKLLRLSAAIGVESVGGADHTFEILTGFGTETIDHGLDVTSFRLLFGTNRGF